MVKIADYYANYLKNVPEYKQWVKENKERTQTNPSSHINLQKKAKAIAEPLLLIDKYEHEKAEDSETFFQTLNIELLSIAGVISALPATITKLTPILNKHSDQNALIKKSADLLNKYANKTVGKKGIPLTKILTIFSAVGGGLFYANGIRKSMNSQLGMIRKASFDATREIIDNPKMFVQTTPEQEKEIIEIAKQNTKSNNSAGERLKDKINILSSFKAVGEYKKNYKTYIREKEKYNSEKEKKLSKNIPLSAVAKQKAEEDKTLFSGMLKTVEHDVLEQLRKVETIANITYASLFTGGFLEYLISDKIVDVLGIKNKAVKTVAKAGIPLVSYMLLNKNISDMENKVILATKYKHLKNFVENPTGTNDEPEKKQTLPEFIKGVIADTKEYNKFRETELPLIEEKLKAKKELNTTPEQNEEAKMLRENTATVVNAHRENVLKQTAGIKALAETILGPLDIVATAAGAKIGHSLSKKNPKFKGLFMATGAIAAFIPAAVIEAMLTKQQKTAEKTAAMLTIKETNNPKLFAKIPDGKYDFNFKQTKKPQFFREI